LVLAIKVSAVVPFVNALSYSVPYVLGTVCTAYY
jgi:hypothetical protein